MRITVRLDEKLIKEANKYVLETACTLTRLLEPSCREILVHSKHQMRNMILIDINILIYAHHESTPGHKALFKFLENRIISEQNFAVSTIVL